MARRCSKLERKVNQAAVQSTRVEDAVCLISGVLLNYDSEWQEQEQQWSKRAPIRAVLTNSN